MLRRRRQRGWPAWWSWGGEREEVFMANGWLGEGRERKRKRRQLAKVVVERKAIAMVAGW